MNCCVLFRSSGCKLSEFERVTALKVYNWFANRRKEMKRRANIGEEDRILGMTGRGFRKCLASAGIADI